MDNSTRPIEDYIRSGLAKRFFNVFAVPLLFYNGPNVKAVADEQLKKRNLPSYPFAVAKTTNFSISESTYKPNSLLRRGLHSRASADNSLTFKLAMIPVTVVYEVTVYIQDFQSVEERSKQWLMAATRNNLNFSVTYAVADIDIKVQLDKNLSVPSREGGATEVKEYLLQSTITVSGYMSDPLIKAQAVTELDVYIQTAQALSDSGGIVTLQTRSWLSPSVPTDLCPADLDDGTFIFDQTSPSSLWVITHNLHKFPSVTVVDVEGNVVEATVNFLSDVTVIVSFTSTFIGRAYLN